jgi:hypothetical protein
METVREAIEGAYRFLGLPSPTPEEFRGALAVLFGFFGDSLTEFEESQLRSLEAARSLYVAALERLRLRAA